MRIISGVQNLVNALASASALTKYHLRCYNLPYMAFPHRFCSECGESLEQPEPAEISQVCGSCETVHYSNAKPCAGAFVIKEGQVMLVRRGIEPYKGYWDIPGGFLNPDEHPEDGAIRELHEETSLQIRPIALHGIYVDSYEYSPDELIYTLNVYYLAEIVEGQEIPQSDVMEIGWFRPAGLPQNVAFEHAKIALDDWANGQSTSGYLSANAKNV